MAPHDWALVIGIAVLAVAEVVASVASWRSRASRPGGGRAESSGAGGRWEESIRGA